uniref:Uncharacterized protein n=1 Tax=Knipowitschia caucasica TaxID=637954 RepID=A0AAV2JMF2_KNICA
MGPCETRRSRCRGTARAFDDVTRAVLRAAERSLASQSRGHIIQPPPCDLRLTTNRARATAECPERKSAAQCYPRNLPSRVGSAKSQTVFGFVKCDPKIEPLGREDERSKAASSFAGKKKDQAGQFRGVHKGYAAGSDERRAVSDSWCNGWSERA